MHLGSTSRILLENLFVHIGSYFQNLCGSLKKEKNHLKIICNCQSYGLVKMFCSLVYAYTSVISYTFQASFFVFRVASESKKVAFFMTLIQQGVDNIPLTLWSSCCRFVSCTFMKESPVPPDPNDAY